MRVMRRVLGTREMLQGFGAETEGKKPLGIPRVKWEYINKMDLKETEIDVLRQRQLVGSCECCNGSSVYNNAEYFLIS